VQGVADCVEGRLGVSFAYRRDALRRAAATRKWPEPQAGSQTVRDSSSETIAPTGSGWLAAEAARSPRLTASSITGSSAESRRQSMSEDGV
jgi:hypothetical protein